MSAALVFFTTSIPLFLGAPLSGPAVNKDPAHVVCICRCCYLGECEPVLTFPAHSHTECERKDCLDRLYPQIEASRQDAIHVLQSSTNCTSAGPCTLPSLANATRLTTTEICIVINLLERETCIGHDKCKSTTSIDAYYVNNRWVFEKFAVFTFLSTVLLLCAAGWIRDMFPFMHQIWERVRQRWRW